MTVASGTTGEPGAEADGVTVTRDEPEGKLAGELTGKAPLDVGATGVDSLLGEVSVTGRTVVEMGIVEVTTVVESAGQSVTVAAHLVIVISLVV